MNHELCVDFCTKTQLKNEQIFFCTTTCVESTGSRPSRQDDTKKSNPVSDRLPPKIQQSRLGQSLQTKKKFGLADVSPQCILIRLFSEGLTKMLSNVVKNAQQC